MMVYLGGPIDAVDVNEARDWRYEMSTELAKHGIASFDPSTAYHMPSFDDNNSDDGPNRVAYNRVVTMNNMAMAYVCDVSFFNLLGDGDKPFGTIREIEHAKHCGKHVIVAGPISLYRHVSAYDLFIVPTVDDAIKEILKLQKSMNAPPTISMGTLFPRNDN